MKYKSFSVHTGRWPVYLLAMSCFFALAVVSSKLQLMMSIVFILAHECGHALAAKAAGYKIDRASILVMPFGVSFGFSTRFIPPNHDIWVSLAGPMMNLLLYALFDFLARFFPQGQMLVSAARVNLVLGIFNLIPAGFLDGGRILRAMLAYCFSYYRSCLVSNVCGVVAGLLILATAIYRGSSPVVIPFFFLGIFFIVNSMILVKRSIFLTLDYILNKNYKLDINKKLKIAFVCYSKNTKLLDIIKNFCFNKYYVVYIIENNNLRYNINEADLICLFCKYGNIRLENCVYYTKEQEGENG